MCGVAVPKARRLEAAVRNRCQRLRNISSSSARDRSVRSVNCHSVDKYVAPAILDIGLQLQGSSLKEVRPPWVKDAELGNTERYLPSGERDIRHR
jgi:hypothetical protein